MINKLGVVLVCFLLQASDGCGSRPADTKPAAAPTAAATHAAPSEAKPAATAAAAPDACALVERSEVEAVQGAKVSGATPNNLKLGPLAVSRCLYTATADDKPGQNLGVLVEVRRPDPANPDPSALNAEWQKIRDKKENKRSERPRRIEGVGDEAYWVGSDRLGALYVLKGDRLVYVSVGGAEEVAAKIEKSKRLALKALARL